MRGCGSFISIVSACVLAMGLSGCAYSMKNKDITKSDYNQVINADNQLYSVAKHLKERRISKEKKELAIYNGEKLSSVLQRLGKLEGVYYYLDKRSNDLELKGIDGYKIYNFTDLKNYVTTIYPNYDLEIEKNQYYKKLPKVVRVRKKKTLSELDAIEFDSRYVNVPSRLFNLINYMLKKKGWSVIDNADVKELFNKETNINFQGSLRKFLEYFAKNNNIFVDFDYTKKQIVFSAYKVKHYPINIPTGVYRFSNVLSMDTASTENQKSQNKLEMQNEYDAIKTLKDAMQKIFTSAEKKSGKEYWFFIDSVNELVVKADPEKLAAVEEVVRNVNNKALKQVMVKLSVYEVSLDKNSQFGIDWNYVYKKAMEIGSFASPGAQMPSFSIDFDNKNSPAVFKYTKRDHKGISFIVNLLKKFGKTKLYYQMPVITTNNIPAVYNIANKKSYIKSLTINDTGTNSNYNGGVNIQVEQADAISGQYIYIKPTILSNDQLMLSTKMIFSYVKDIQKQDFQNGMYVQTPDIDENVYSQNLIISSGEKVIIGGFTIKGVRKDYSGMTDKPTFLTGLDKDAKTNKEIVLVIEAKEL